MVRKVYDFIMSQHVYMFLDQNIKLSKHTYLMCFENERTHVFNVL